MNYSKLGAAFGTAVVGSTIALAVVAAGALAFKFLGPWWVMGIIGFGLLCGLTTYFYDKMP